MSTYTVVHSCGHTQEHGIGGAYAERERKAKWMESTLCSECYADHKAKAEMQKVNAQVDAVQTLVKRAGISIAALTGSEKQIAWAERIRIVALARTHEAALRHSMYGKEQFANLLGEIIAQTDACWWIDNRNFNEKAVDFDCFGEWAKKAHYG